MPWVRPYVQLRPGPRFAGIRRWAPGAKRGNDDLRCGGLGQSGRVWATTSSRKLRGSLPHATVRTRYSSTSTPARLPGPSTVSSRSGGSGDPAPAAGAAAAYGIDSHERQQQRDAQLIVFAVVAAAAIGLVVMVVNCCTGALVEFLSWSWLLAGPGGRLERLQPAAAAGPVGGRAGAGPARYDLPRSWTHCTMPGSRTRCET